MDQSVDEPQPPNIDQVPENLVFIKQEQTDDDEQEQLVHIPQDNQGPSCGESGNDHDDGDNEEGNAAAGHLQPSHHYDRPDEEYPASSPPPNHTDGSSVSDAHQHESSASHEIEHVPSRSSTPHDNALQLNEVNGQANSTSSQWIKSELIEPNVFVPLPVNQFVHNPHHQPLCPDSANPDANNELHDDSQHSNIDEYRQGHAGEEVQQIQQHLSNVTDNDNNESNEPLPNAPLMPSGSRLLAPSSRPSIRNESSFDFGELIGQKISGDLKGRYFKAIPEFKSGKLSGEFEGTFEINCSNAVFRGSFNGEPVAECYENTFHGKVYDAKLDGKFVGGREYDLIEKMYIYGGSFSGTLTGRIVGTLNGVSNEAPVRSNRAYRRPKIKDESAKSAIEVIDLEADVDAANANNVPLMNPASNGQLNCQTNRQIEDTSNQSAHYQIPHESDVVDGSLDDDDVDDNQSDVSNSSANSSVASEDETTSNNPDSRDQQPQLRKSLRIVELEQLAALKRTQQQELLAEVENIVPDVKRTKTKELDKSQSRKTMSVKCSDCPTSFDTFAEMYAHKWTVHEVARYSCFADGCTQSFDNKYRLSVHSAANHPKGTTQFACRNCSEKFRTQTSAKAHFNKCVTKGVFGCTCCSCHTEMISLTTAHDHLDPLNNTSAYCTETAKCGKTFTNKRALIIHKSDRHRLYKHSTVHRCKLCNILCTFNSKTMIKHFRSVHSVKGQLMKCFEQNTETMTKEQVDLAIKKLGKQGNRRLVAALDPFGPSTSGTQHRPVHSTESFGPSTSGTQRRPMHSFDNGYDQSDNDDDEGAYYRAIPSTSQQQSSYGQDNQFRHPKCLVRDLTKE